MKIPVSNLLEVLQPYTEEIRADLFHSFPSLPGGYKYAIDVKGVVIIELAEGQGEYCFMDALLNDPSGVLSCDCPKLHALFSSQVDALRSLVTRYELLLDTISLEEEA